MSNDPEDRILLLLVASAAAAMSCLLARPLDAQRQTSSPCRVVCSPVVSVMPALIRSHLFGGPRVINTATGAIRRLPSSSNFELIVAAASETRVSRLGLFGSVQWLPNAAEGRNPFTLYTASELGGAVHANAPTATLGASAKALTADETHGALDVSVNVGGLFSKAARPSDRSAYTGKLDLELFTTWHVFAWTPPRTYVHRISAFALLDYLATGLPRTGDEVPKGQRYLDDARPTSLIAGLSIPLTPGGK
jgi:hypothetical protein